MSDTTFQLLAVGLYFAAMIGIGFYAYRKTSNLDDYMLAGRDLKPSVAAISAGASDMSGWLLMGLPGAIYLMGLVEAWIAIGLTVGAWLNWKFVAPRLRSYTEISNNSITVPSFLENRFKDKTRILRIAAGVIILLFFTFYVSSGMVAGGKFFEASFGVPYFWGMVLVAGVTLLYTLFGGFLGASLTDVAQGFLMLAALVAVPVVAVISMGGVGEVINHINLADAAANAADPANELHRTSLIYGGTALGIISACAWGLGYFGQPHIIVRFMALRSPQDAKAGRRIGISWMILTAAGAISTALVGIAWFNKYPETLEDPETVFLRMSQILFHPFVAGLVLAAVLAAIMSTISSQLIVCSSALVEDLYGIMGRKTSDRTNVSLGRVGVLIVALVAGMLALDPSSSILELVAFAWAGFGAAFGPVIILALYWKKFTSWGALAAMVSGAVTVFIWGSNDALSSTLYEIVPGFIIATVLGVVVSLLTTKHHPVIDREFAEMKRHAAGETSGI
ncbi:sodium/proline symporter [Neomicrococcus aestuarii]|uniref:Sodium/proline symporter n=1 Tax=Neomicrococcus aestuarii TaxID=556325 RepID=A0A7W8X1T8_9MICC|nr:sodium/proline symporter PutP [Neomicrococcus aestuarii]MBB5513154.1 sodium/proline symporter [Neomicrococcus aestuarii]